MSAEIAPQRSTLDLDESRTLAECEAVIERGLTTFLETGSALLTVRDRRLYRATHDTFESYCQDRFKITPNYARRLITATEITSELVPIGTVPENESQVRPLSVLSPPERKEAWQEAVEKTGGKPTAKAVKEAVEKRMPPKPEKPKRRRPQPRDEEEDVEDFSGWSTEPKQRYVTVPIDPHEAAQRLLLHFKGKALASLIAALAEGSE